MTFNILAESLAHLFPLFIRIGNQYNHSSASPFRNGKTLYRQCHPLYRLRSGRYIPGLVRNTSLPSLHHVSSSVSSKDQTRGLKDLSYCTNLTKPNMVP